MRTKLMEQPTSRPSQVANNAAKAHLNNDPSNPEPIKIENSTSKTEQKPKNHESKLIFHYTHEKRFPSSKRGIHQTYEDIFKNTPAMDVKLIVGNRNRRASANDLIRKRPKKSLLKNKQSESKYSSFRTTRRSLFQRIDHSYFHSIERSRNKQKSSVIPAITEQL